MTRKRTIRFGSLRAARDATGIATGTWQRIERGDEVEMPTLIKAAEALWNDTAVVGDLLDGRDPEAPTSQDTTDYYAAAVAESPEHIQRTIDDLLMQHSASFRRTRGGS